MKLNMHLIISHVGHPFTKSFEIGNQWLNKPAWTVHFKCNKTACNSRLNATRNLQSIRTTNSANVDINPKRETFQH